MNKFIVFANIIYISVVLVMSVQNTILCIKELNNSKVPYDNMFFGSNITEEQKNDIDEICEYIIKQGERGIDVKIISYKAMMYMSPLKKNNGELDLVFLGNLGKSGEDGVIEKIKNLYNTQILIVEDEEDIIQEPKKVRTYIMENLQNCGSIGDFLIYKSPVYDK